MTLPPPSPSHACVGFSQVCLMHGSCGAERSGPHWLNRPGIISECGPEFALSEGTVHLLCTASEASEVQGRSGLDQPPAGRIRCYLSDWGHRHQSLLSTFLCPESNQHRVIHLCWRRAGMISNQVCQNFAMFAWCVKGEVIMYLSLHATGVAFFTIRGCCDKMLFCYLIIQIIACVLVSHQCSTANQSKCSNSPGGGVILKKNMWFIRCLFFGSYFRLWHWTQQKLTD